MARPLKEGLDYFPMDVDADMDDKVEYVIAKCGFQAFGVYVKLLMSIYKNGCFMDFGEIQKTVFSRRVYMNVEDVDVILKECIRVGLFDKDLYEKDKILTSSSIQRRYLAATEKRKNTAIPSKINLLNDFNGEISNEKTVVSDELTTENEELIPKKLHEKEVNTELTQQSKVKESKVYIYNSKELLPPKGDTQAQKIPYQEIVEHYNRICVSLAQCKELEGKRRTAIKARFVSLGYSMSKLDEFLQKVEMSDFVTGRDGKWTGKRGIDWIFKQSNFNKIQEGNYDNRRPEERSSGGWKVV